MIHKLVKRPAVSAIALAAVALTATASQAAENQAILESVSFQTQAEPSTIRVISTDGVRWNAIQDGNILIMYYAVIRALVCVARRSSQDIKEPNISMEGDFKPISRNYKFKKFK